MANIHAPNLDEPEFFRRFLNEIDKLNVDQKIITGDFNLVLDLMVAKQGGQAVTHTNASQVIKAYMTDNNLVDIWRYLHPEENKFTLKRLIPSPVFVRLDFFLVSELLSQVITIADIYPGFKTDHSIPMINLVMAEND